MFVSVEETCSKAGAQRRNDDGVAASSDGCSSSQTNATSIPPSTSLISRASYSAAESNTASTGAAEGESRFILRGTGDVSIHATF